MKIQQNPRERIRRSREDAKKIEAFSKGEQRKIENAIMESGVYSVSSFVFTA